NGDQRNQEKSQELTFYPGETNFYVTEWGGSAGIIVEFGYGGVSIESSKDYYFEKEEVFSNGLIYGVGASVVPVDFGALKGQIILDKKLSGSSLLELFSQTKSI